MLAEPRDTPSLALSTVAALAVAGAWIWVRLFVFTDLVLPLTYVLPLLLCVWTRRYWQLWGMAAAFAVAATIKQWILLPEQALPTWADWATFLATLFNIGIGMAIIAAIMRMRGQLERQAQGLAEQNAEISAQAEELTQQNEEIAQQSEELSRQNEELQSQSEELERQNEELQQINENLAQREELLQVFLDLTRRPATGGRPLDDICHRMIATLGEPTIGIAILQRQGDLLVAVGSAGVESTDLVQRVWPYAGSIGELVANHRTACVDDLEARPDIGVPSYRGKASRSVLAAPIRSHSTATGAVVICGSVPFHWTQEQFRIAEWIAGQCALILEAMQWQDELREVALLAQQNPDAVIRVLTGGTVIYANPAGVRMLRERESGIDHAAPQELWEPAQEVMRSSKAVDREVSVGDRVFSVRYVPVPDREYVNIYAHDVTLKHQLRERIGRAMERYALLAETAAQLLKSADPQEVAESLCRRVMGHLECDVFFNFMLDETSGRLKLNACRGVAAEDAAKIEWLEMGSAICGCVAQQGERIVAEDIQNSSDARAALVRSYGVQAYCSCPLLVGRKVIGTISFGTRQRTHFTNEEIDLIQAVADQVAVAMQRIGTEQELRKASQRVERVINSITDGLLVLDRQWRYTYFSEQAARIIRVKREDILGNVAWDLFPHARGTKFYEFYHRAMETMQVQHFEEYYPEPLNQWLECYCYPSEAGLTVYFHDVTARRQAEEALNRSNLLISAISENSGDVIYAKDLEGRLTYANRATLELVGKPMEQVIGHTDLETLNDKDVARQVMANDRRIMDSGVAEELEECVPMPDGRRVIWLSRKVPYRDTEGKVIGLLGVSRDITERKRSEEELRLSEQRLRLALDAARMVAWEYDPATLKVSFSDNVEKVLELARRNGNSKQGYSLVHPDDVEDHRARVNKAIATGGGYVSEYRHAHGQRVIWLEEQGQAVVDKAGKTVRLVGVIQDITSRKLAEAALREAKNAAEAASQAKDNFLAALSHELRTPLTPVLTAAMLMEKDCRLAPEVREDAAMIRRNVALETRLIDDLLDLTRISRGKMQLQLGHVSLCDLLRHTAGICSPEADAKGVKLTVELAAVEGCMVKGDSARLQQVFWNILRNAIKFTPEGGSITIRGSVAARTGEGYGVVIDTIDTGKGIDPAMLPRLFRPFEQGDPSITRQFGGLGLGLSICRSLLEFHGGVIEAMSEGLGKGATFRVILPLADSLPVTAKPDRGSSLRIPVAQEPLQILLVEDHEDTAKLMTRVLNMSGHTVYRAGDVAGGLAIAEQRRFDLVLSDLGLPDGSGLDLMRQLRQTGARFKAVALSGYGTEEDLRRSAEAGFDAHLTKPVNLQILTETIGRLTGKATEGAGR